MSSQAAGWREFNRSTVLSAVGEQTLSRLSEVMALLGAPVYLRLVLLLSDGEAELSRVADALGLAKAKALHHLGILRRARLVDSRRAGRDVYYALHASVRFSAADRELDLAVTERGARVRIRLPDDPSF